MRPTDALEHPADWTLSTVGKEVEIRRGLSWSKEQESSEAKDYTVPVLRISNIQSRLELDDILHLSGVPEKARQMKKASKNWSVLVGSNGNRNRIGNAVFLSVDTDFLFASFLIAAKPRDASFLLPEFFFRWLNAYEVQARLSASAEGSTGLSNLSHDFFKAMGIAFPKPDEQLGIVRILGVMDAAIERTHTAIDKARRVKKSLVQTLFSGGIGHNSFKKAAFGQIPCDWKVVAVGDVLNEAQYGLSMPMQAKGQYPILRMAAIQDGSILLDDLKYVDLPDRRANDYLLQRGDILFNRTNSGDLVGKVGVYRSDATAVFASYLIRLKTKPELVDNYFLGQLLTSYPVQCRIRRYATPGVQQVNINATNLQRVQIALPVGVDGLKEQREIAEILETQDNYIRQIEGRVLLLARLKRGLLQDLLTGRRRVVSHVGKTVEVQRLLRL